MDYSRRLAVSYYKTIANIDENHNVYLVQHQETGKICVKKILDIYNIDVYEYLLNHHIEGIPDIIDFCEEDGSLILIEEYVSGTTLKERMEAGSIDINEAVAWIVNLCEIVENLHHAVPPIIHRDIKPSNIILTQYNKVVLLDFNAAKYFKDSDSVDTVLLGTQGYAAPEQYGFGSSSPRTDIYSLGIILKEISENVRDNPEIFNDIIERCTRMNPTERFDSVSEVKTAMINLVSPHHTGSIKSAGHKYVFPGYRSRTPWKMVAATLGYLGIFSMCMTIQVENVHGAALWVERLVMLLIMLSIIFGCFNYMDIHKYFPMCRHGNRGVRYLGICILNATMMFVLILAMFIIETVFL